MATIETAYYVPTLLGLSTTFGISCTISAVCVIAFEGCRRLDSMQCLFSPRTRLLTNTAPPPLSKTPFAWLKATFWLDEPYYIQRVGLDATMYLRFLRMAVHFLVLQALIVCPVLLSIHWTASPWDQRSEWDMTHTALPNATLDDHHVDQFRSNSTLYSLSIANIPDHNPILWVHVLFIFSVSLTWLWLLFVNHWHHLQLLQVTGPSHLIHARSILISNVPNHLRNEASLRYHFSSAQIGSIESITLVSRTACKALERAFVRREKWLDQLEFQLIALARIIIQEDKPASVLFDEDQWTELPLKAQKRGISLEAMQELMDQLEELDSEIKRLRNVNESPEYYMPTGTAFATFASPHSAQICAQIVTSWKPGVMETRMAPEPRDLLWPSLLRRGRRDKMMGKLRQCVVFIAVWTLTIFWLFPISFILGLTSIDSLSQHFGFLRYFLDTSIVVRSFIQNILPALLVTLFMSLLPWILLEISKQQDFVSYSELEDCVLGRYYHFAIFNVLIVFLLGTTFLSTMLDVLYEPGKLIQLLANSLPQGANFFLNYILFNSATHAMELIQLGSQIFGHLILTVPWISRTPRILKRFTSPWSFPYYYYYPNHILVLVITVTYSVIQPLILIFALFYYTLALACYRHQFAYCYVRRYESGGSRHYQRMARYTSDGLLIFQLTMVGLFYLKGVLSAATAILPLIIFTIWTKVKFVRLFARRAKHPYVGKFTTATSNDPAMADGASATKKFHRPIPRSRWLASIDEIWKFTYLKAWWAHGRYASQIFAQSSVADDPSSRKPVVVEPEEVTAASRLREMSGSSSTNKSVRASPTSTLCTDEQLLKEVDEHDLTVLPNDAKSAIDTYDHPALVRELDNTLYLPRDPTLKRWDLKQCIKLQLESMHYALQQLKATSPSSDSSPPTQRPSGEIQIHVS
ncbi:uncharacterized protein BYT42DRAFT_590150 [Radiomyces spectabilis]|uniref:uncharacterized protein n=1 Tax=Radiomyces spectabilis TaxID=64574 RepID=UPI002221274D|nr:uncharacterized protein BYT42DRAFT_590150 [Radiomyces spectabilis]KAI8364721.1 hypothetical protein BYT42DRAFT_590150 [Radiomyces spectabilis]